MKVENFESMVDSMLSIKGKSSYSKVKMSKIAPNTWNIMNLIFL